MTKEHVNQAPEAFEGVYRSEIKDPDTAVAAQLFVRYIQRHGKSVTLPWYVATSYDAVVLLAKALRAVGPDPAALKDHLYSIKDFPGASKEISGICLS